MSPILETILLQRSESASAVSIRTISTVDSSFPRAKRLLRIRFALGLIATIFLSLLLMIPYTVSI